jgi:hypothetical protein
MFESSAVTWMFVALLVPFWWGMGLLVLALLGDMSPRWRVRISRLFDRLDRMREEPPKSTVLPERPAARKETSPCHR